MICVSLILTALDAMFIWIERKCVTFAHKNRCNLNWIWALAPNNSNSITTAIIAESVPHFGCGHILPKHLNRLRWMFRVNFSGQWFYWGFFFFTFIAFIPFPMTRRGTHVIYRPPFRSNALFTAIESISYKIKYNLFLYYSFVFCHFFSWFLNSHNPDKCLQYKSLCLTWRMLSSHIQSTHIHHTYTHTCKAQEGKRWKGIGNVRIEFYLFCC